MYEYHPNGPYDIDDGSEFKQFFSGVLFLCDPPSSMVYDSPSLVEEEDMNTTESGSNGLQQPNGIRKLLITSTVFLFSLALVSYTSITFQRKRRAKIQQKNN
ncbi:unnamed protein product [Ilex paraguariensis]